MKELYLDAEMEVVNFSIADVITTSAETEPEITEAPIIEDDGPIDWEAWADQ